MTKEKIINKILAFTMFSFLLPWSGAFASSILEPVPGVTVDPGAVNRVSIEKNGRFLDIYGPAIGRATAPDRILLTHSRRDAVWPIFGSGFSNLFVTAPEAEAERLSQAADYWAEMAENGQFHDYEQQSSKVVTEKILLDRTVREGDQIQWEGLTFAVIDTPGYTRGAVSYLLDIEGRNIAFTGDLIYGDGKLIDLFSLQDAVPGSKIRGYHGWAGRIGILLESLRKVRQRQCDILIPARGPVIDDPERAIDRLIERIQSAYANYLAINAGRWYFKDDYDMLAERALGSSDRVDWMPWAEKILSRPPEWVKIIDNTRLIVSEDGSGFLVDCGSEKIFNEVRALQKKGTVTSIDGMFITHYHDDHTDFAGRAAEFFNCPVYSTRDSADILENPAAYRLPAMTPNPIKDIRKLPDGFRMNWKEFSLEFFYFPGQTIYHDAMLVSKESGEKLFFMGDSFSPSGVDDYCLLNRNLLQEGTGYFYCLEFLKKLPSQVLLINEHIKEPFSFSRSQIDLMIETLRDRKALLAELFPWDDPNYGIDEQWARFYPYRLSIGKGEDATVSVHIFNHSPGAKNFRVKINAPPGIIIVPKEREIRIEPHREADISFRLATSDEEIKEPLIRVITADIEGAGIDFRQWCEGIILAEPGP